MCITIKDRQVIMFYRQVILNFSLNIFIMILIYLFSIFWNVIIFLNFSFNIFKNKLIIIMYLFSIYIYIIFLII